MSTINDLLHKSCLAHPVKPAFRVKKAGQWIDHSYHDLWSASGRIAAGLAAWGFEPGERCALLGVSSPAWMKAYVGGLRANGIVVPIDKDLKQNELRHILADCKARILFTEQEFLETLLETAEDLPALDKIVLINSAEQTNGQLPAQAEAALAALVGEWHRLAVEYRISSEDLLQFEELAEGAYGLLAPTPPTRRKNGRKVSLFSRLTKQREGKTTSLSIQPLQDFAIDADIPSLQRKAEDTAVILYTSGTTGRSKGASLSHANIVSNIQAAVELFSLDSSMTTLSFLPINHVFEQVCGILLPLSLGGTISFAESIKKIGENMAEVKPSFLLGVPAVFRMLHDRLTRRIQAKTVSRALFSFGLTRPLVTRKIRENLGGSPVFISGGAALDPMIEQGLMEMGVTVYQGYGITETSPIISAESPALRRLGTVGRPLAGVEVRINEPNEDGVGEIWVKGPNVMQGYHNNPEATAEVLTDGWYHTGDLGRLETDGVLSICGRVKNLIVTANGKNVYPEEIENELLNSPFICEIMVYGHKVSETVEEVHAMIYPDQDALEIHARDHEFSTFSERDIESLIRREVLEYGKNLADYKRVRRFTLRNEEFPKTTTRKIKRFAVEADIVTER